MASLTLEQIISLYAPLMGLVALAFWTGVLSNRVRQLESDNKARTDLRPDLAALTATVDALGRRITDMKNDNHEAFKEVNHVLRNRLMIEQALDSKRERA